MNYLEIVLKGPSRGGDNMKNWKIYAISFVFRLLNYNVFFLWPLSYTILTLNIHLKAFGINGTLSGGFWGGTPLEGDLKMIKTWFQREFCDQFYAKNGVFERKRER